MKPSPGIVDLGLSSTRTRFKCIPKTSPATPPPSADVNLQDTNGNTALMEAVGRGDVKTVKSLLTHGANFDLEDTSGETALSQAKSLKKTSFSMEKEFDDIINLLEKKK
jgi:hypothetical protein